MSELGDAEAGGVSGGENGILFGVGDAFQKTGHLLGAQNHRQLLRRFRPGDEIDTPGLLESDFVKETESRGDDDQTAGGQLPFTRQVNLVSADLLGPQKHRRFVEVPGKGGYLLHVGGLGSGRQMAHLHVFDHALTKRVHRDTPYRNGFGAGTPLPSSSDKESL